MKKPFTVGSLFAGVGGICLGFQNAKNKNAEYKIIWANEIDQYACETYRTNFNHTLLEGDINIVLHPEKIDENIENLKSQISDYENTAIKLSNDIAKLNQQINCDTEAHDTTLSEPINENTKNIKAQISDYENNANKLLNEINILNKQLFDDIANRDKQFNYYKKLHDTILSKPIDILNGGFPCQAFSIAGEQKGFDDERGNLFLSIIDLVEQLAEKYYKPRILFLENVKNLKSHKEGNTYKVIKAKLESCGYIIKEMILNTMDYSNLPQNRERIYIIGFLNSFDAERFTMFNNLDKYKVNKTSDDRANDIKSLIDYSVSDKKYYYTKAKYPHYFLSEDEFNALKGDKKSVRINLTEDVNELYQFYQVRRGQYVRKNKSDVCPTLTANMGTGGHNVPLILTPDKIVRKLTPAETFRLQGFPVGNGYELPTSFNGKSYSDSNLYKQAGNAVSVPVITLIAEQLLEILAEN